MEKTPLDNFENIDEKPDETIDKLINILEMMPKGGYTALTGASAYAYGQYWKATENITDWSMMQDLPAFKHWLSEPMTIYIPALIATCMGLFELAVRAKDESTAMKISKMLNKAYILVFLVSFGHTMYQQNYFNQGSNSVDNWDTETIDSEAFRQGIGRAEEELRIVIVREEAPTTSARTNPSNLRLSNEVTDE